MSPGLGVWLVMKNDDVTMWTKLSKDVRIMRFNNKNPRRSQSQANNGWPGQGRNGKKGNKEGRKNQKNARMSRTAISISLGLFVA